MRKPIELAGQVQLRTYEHGDADMEAAFLWGPVAICPGSCCRVSRVTPLSLEVLPYGPDSAL